MLAMLAILAMLAMNMSHPSTPFLAISSIAPAKVSISSTVV
jgi:hypothetical protein